MLLTLHIVQWQSVGLEFSRFRVLIHPRPNHTKDFKNGTNYISVHDHNHIRSLSQVNNASAYAVGLRLTMLQIYLYQYWTVAETQKKGRSAPRPCVDLIIIIRYTNKTQIWYGGMNQYFFKTKNPLPNSKTIFTLR